MQVGVQIQYNTDDSINRYKAWLVAKGYTQQHDIDYDETFEPITKMTIVHVLLAVATTKGWHLHDMDVKKLRNRCTWYIPPDITPE